ncbi:uncharacterized protein TNCV_2482521 [Trichonephila clavipes]|nr:uncharacterized protein TNCV_2482521 [Trichonephila clavipes]
MEPLGVYRIFERSVEMRKLQYVNFFGDGDSKGYASVKDIYGKNTVAKYECIGHIQKRVGTKLRKLKSKRKDLGGRGKLTDAFIDKLQNYYGIAIRDNVNNLQGMQRAIIAAFSIVALMQNNKCMANALLDRIVGVNINKPYQRIRSTSINLKDFPQI